MRRVAGKISEHFRRELGMEIAGVNVHEGSYIVSVVGGKVFLRCPHDELVIKIGHLLFDEEGSAPSLSDILEVSFISLTDERSLDWTIGRISEVLKRSDFSIWDFDTEFDEIVIQDKVSSYFLLIDLGEFMERYKGLAFGLGRLEEKMISELKNSKLKRLSLQEVRELERYKGLNRRY